MSNFGTGARLASFKGNQTSPVTLPVASKITYGVCERKNDCSSAYRAEPQERYYNNFYAKNVCDECHHSHIDVIPNLTPADQTVKCLSLLIHNCSLLIPACLL